MPKFSFGANWARFAESCINDERVARASQNLLEILNRRSLEDVTFCDVGSGSGIHSLAAARAGAHVVSFDLDSKAVETTAALRNASEHTERWMVKSGSVLDLEFLKTLGTHDIVYSWGVLHHTGQMWSALDNVITLLKDDGKLFIAIYATLPNSDLWLKIKGFYNLNPRFAQRLMEFGYTACFIVSELKKFRNPFSYILNYKRNRGMDFLTDVRDWLGGLPYEHAKIEEVVRFMKKRGLRLDNIKTGEGCVEYLFAR